MADPEMRKKYNQPREELELEDQPNLQKVLSCEISLDEICIACDRMTDNLKDHPLFEASLCYLCYTDMQQWGMCCYGHDGKGYTTWCVVCTNGGESFYCENPQCKRSYCLGCVKYLVSELAMCELLTGDDESQWYCFHCTEYTEETHGLLRPRSDAQTVTHLQNMFVAQHMPVSWKPNVDPEEPRPPLKVLSLFDGISAGSVALRTLQLDISEYHASEIDEDAILVAITNNKDINRIGDVCKITTDKLRERGPFDLMIGGSPCNELSSVNPKRGGIHHGTGTLFFEYHRIRSKIRELWPDHICMFLFENVSSMRHEDKAVISRFLDREPALWQGEKFSPAKRDRLFWGNIPCLSSPPTGDETYHQGLDSVLMPHRTAAVKRLNTVTCTESVPGKKRKLPVKMANGESDMWPSELDILFGFPQHYTDVNGFPKTKRKKLLGKSWCVRTVSTILAPLRFFYKVKES